MCGFIGPEVSQLKGAVQMRTPDIQKSSVHVKHERVRVVEIEKTHSQPIRLVVRKVPNQSELS